MVAHLWREWYITVSMCFQHFASGVVLGFPAVLTPAITRNDSDILATKEEASWIAASYGFSAGLAFLITPGILQLKGRKFLYIILNVLMVIGAITITIATNIAMIMIGRIIQGVVYSGYYLSCLVLAEYTHPKRRGFFMTIKMAWSFSGVLACHCFGFIISWRLVSLLSVVPSIVSIIMTYTWPESPSWLAYKSRYDECATSFEWLRGSGIEAQAELKELITAQKELRKLDSDHSSKFLKIVEAFRRKEFLKPLLIDVLLLLLLNSSGEYYAIAYLTEIMLQLTGNKSKVIYYTIAFNVMKVIASLICSVLVKISGRRILLFSSSLASCSLLAVICVTRYLEVERYIATTWASPVLLIVYNFVVSVGVIPLAIIIKGEIFPIQYKGIGPSIIGVLNGAFMMLTLKLTSSMLTVLKAHGTFAVYLVVALSSFLGLYFVMPETKDRTLQNIEIEFSGLKLENMNNEVCLIDRSDLKESKLCSS